MTRCKTPGVNLPYFAILTGLIFLFSSCGQLKFNDFNKRKYLSGKLEKKWDESDELTEDLPFDSGNTEMVDFENDELVESENLPDVLEESNTLAADELDDVEHGNNFELDNGSDYALESDSENHNDFPKEIAEEPGAGASQELDDFNFMFNFSVAFLFISILCLILGFIFGPGFFFAYLGAMMISWISGIGALKRSRKIPSEEVDKKIKRRKIFAKMLAISPVLFIFVFILLLYFIGF